MQTIPNAQKKAKKHFAPTWVQLCFFAFLCAFSALCTLFCAAMGMHFGVMNVLQNVTDSSQNAHLTCGKGINTTQHLT
jgi:hypothetical protein